MANDSRTLLAKLVLQTKDAKTVVADLKKQLRELHTESKAASAEKTALAKKELEAQEKLLAKASEMVDGTQMEIRAIESKLKFGKQDLDARKALILEEKKLLDVQQAQLNVIKLQPKFREADLTALMKRIQQEKAELALIEAKMKMGLGILARPTDASGIEASPAKLAQMQAKTASLSQGLASAQASLNATVNANAMKDAGQQLKSGELSEKAYLEKMKALYAEQHKIKLQQITQQRNATEAMYQAEFKLGKLSAEQLAIKMQTLDVKFKEMLEKANQVNKMAAGPRTLGQTAERGFARSALGVGSMMFGGGLPVEMMAAFTAGTLLERILEKIAGRIREIFTGSGKDVHLAETFEQLATGKGQEALTVMGKLQDATKGLVKNEQLYQVGNVILRSSIKATTAQHETMLAAVVKLARAQGKDATEAVSAYTRAVEMGNARALTRVVGLERMSLTFRGIPPAADAATRSTLQWKQMYDVITAQAAKTKEPVETFADVINRARIGVDNFYEELALGIAKNRQFQTFIKETLGLVAQFVGWLSSNGPKIGDILGRSIAIVSAVFSDVKGTVASLWDVIDSTTRRIGELATLTDNTSKSLDENRWVTAIKNVLLLFQQTWSLIHATVQQTATDIEFIGGAMTRMLTTNPLKWKQAFAELDEWYLKASDNIDKQQAQNYKKTLDALWPGQKKPEAVAGSPSGNKQPPNFQLLSQLAKLDLQIAKATEKEKLELTMERIKLEEDANKQLYEDGAISIKAYLAKSRILFEQEHQAKLADMRSETDAKLKEIDLEVKYNKLTPQVATKQKQLVGIQERLQEEKEQIAHNQRLEQLNRELLQDMRSARLKYIQETGKIEESSIKEREKDLEDEFKDGKVAANDYLTYKKQLLQDELNATLRQLDAEKEAHKDNETELAALTVAGVQARIKNAQDVAALERKAEDVRIEAVKKRNSESESLLEAQLSLAQHAGSGISESGTIQMMQEVNDQFLKQMHERMQAVENDGDIFTDKWFGIAKAINGAYEKQYKFNEELMRSKQILAPVANLFSTLGKAFGGINKGFGETMQRTAQGIQDVYALQKPGRPGQSQLGGLKESFTALFKKVPLEPVNKTDQEKLNAGIRETTSDLAVLGTGLKNLPEDATAGFKNVFNVASASVRAFVDAINDSISALKSGVASAGASPAGELPLKSDPSGTVPVLGPGETQETANGLGTVYSSIDVTAEAPKVGFFKALENSFTNLVKKVDGGSESVGTFKEKFKDFTDKLSGYIQGIGNFVQSTFGARTGASGALGGGMAGLQLGMMVGGPIGGAIGGIGGALMGGVFGSKQAALQHKVDMMNTQLDAIRRGVQDGALHMGDAISQLTALRSSAMTTFSNSGKKSSKKNPGQAQATISAINSELGQLLQMQKQALDQMHSQIDTLSNPQPFAQYIQGLQEIIDQYKKFSDAAAGNAKEVANAQNYLVLSLKNYLLTESQNLLQNQQQAIQNAIALNDQLQQRNQMENQYAQQVFGIMNQGVLTRTYSGAQTKASQLAELKQQHDIQKQTLDEQIAVAQDRYDQEKSIFSLASTRVGLESQLLTAQRQQTTFDIQRVQALQKVVDTLKSIDLTKITGLQQIFDMLGLAVPAGLGDYGLPAGAGGPGTPPTPRFAPATYKGYQFFKQLGGWDVYRKGNSWKLVGPDGKMYNASDMGVNPVDQWDSSKGGQNAFPYAEGGSYHAGEARITGEQGPELDIPDHSGTILSNKVLRAISQVAQVSMPNTSTGGQVNAHGQILSMASQRAAIESAILNAQQNYVNSDLARIQALRSLLHDVRGVQGGLASGSLESLFNALYNKRGLMGASGFRGV